MKKQKQQADATKSLPSWDLSVAFYSGLNDPKIEEDKKRLAQLCKEISLYSETIEDLAPYELSIMLRKYEAVIELRQKLSYFAFLYSDTHKTDEEVSQFQSKINEDISRSFEDLEFLRFELNKLSDEKKLEFINYPRLQRWLPWLTSMFVGSMPITEAIAYIINKKSGVSDSWDRLYNETCACLKFHFKNKVLNEAEIRALLTNKSADVRRAAMIEMNRVYKENERIFTMCLNMIMKDKSNDDELYNMEEPVTDSLYSNHISKEDLLTMATEVVDTNIPVAHRFYKLKAKLMNKEHIGYEDHRYNPIEVESKKISWEECVQQVLEAYEKFSPDYMECAKEIIEAGIIDVPPRKGKTSGAYCIRGRYPYILLNFTGDPSDANTFAHELGHAVHHILSAQIGLLNDATPTALSEVASEFAENLLFQQQLAKVENNKERLSLLISHVQDMINSIHRQIAIYKFEERAHRERKKGELSTARLNQIWREEMSRCMGFDIGEEAECMWMGISHIFTMPYYVYSYAFAGLLVNNLVEVYKHWNENGELLIQENFDDLYLDMLSNTGVEDFVSLLEPFGINADEDPDFWANGISVITKYIDEIEKLAKEEGLL